MVVGLLSLGTACAFSSRSRGSSRFRKSCVVSSRLVVEQDEVRIETYQYPEGAYPQGATQPQAVGLLNEAPQWKS